MRNWKLVFAGTVTALVLVTCVTPRGTHTGVDTFRDYGAWMQVNATPITGDETGMLGSTVHGGETGFRNVFVNSIGEPVSTGAADLPYPVGTIVVKETFRPADGQPGRLAGVTVMVKRDAGYDPDHGDWEYLNLSAGLRIRSAGALRACYECHIAATASDYIFTDRR